MQEDKFLESLIKNLPPLKNGEIGVGDDSAFLFIPEGSILITQDSFSEKIHFPSNFPLKYSIKRAFLASLSDINAMGGRAKYLLCTIGISKERAKELNRIFISLAKECEKYGIKIVGGDTVSSEKAYFTITILGFLPQGKKPLLRSEAKEGEYIYLSNPIGKMGIAIKVIKGENLKISSWKKNQLIKYYFNPYIPYPLGEKLLLRFGVKCCIDISDGLVIDLYRICRRSKIGAEIEEILIPYDESVYHSNLYFEELTNFVLSSGEEFSLLFTSPKHNLPFRKIGRTFSSKEPVVLLKKGEKIKKLKPIGFDHFIP